MPVYEYRCRKCGAEFEEWQRITDSPVDKCKSCGGKASRLISQSSFVLKGTGWYVTDYGRKDQTSCSEHKASKNAGEKASESKESGTNSSSGTSSE